MGMKNKYLLAGAAALSLTLACAALRRQPQNADTPRFLAAPAAFRSADMNGPIFATVGVDTTKVQSANLDALRDVAVAAPKIALPLPADTAQKTPETEWFRWGRLKDSQASVTVRGAADSTAPPIAVYAVTGPQGAAALLANRSDRPVTVTFRLRLNRGAYALEQLEFSPAAPSSSENESALPLPAAKRTSLGGGDFASVRVAERRIALRPGGCVLIRATNAARLAVGAYYMADERLTDLRGSASGLGRRLRKMLRDGQPSLKSLTASGGRHSGNRRIAAIHQLLLLTAQAQALERNYLARGVVKQIEGAAIADALEALSEALSQTSAVVLNLAPQIEVAPDAKDARSALVTVSLRNDGTQSVSSVKLGIDGAALPAGFACKPSDPAFFDELRPGQSVEAAFQLVSDSHSTPSAVRCTADVSYLAAACPAHLRPRSQF